MTLRLYGVRIPQEVDFCRSVLTIRRRAFSSSNRPVGFYSLDAIISVGYRVKSQRGVGFRRWATDVLHRYIVEGYAANERRLRELDQAMPYSSGLRVRSCWQTRSLSPSPS